MKKIIAIVTTLLLASVSWGGIQSPRKLVKAGEDSFAFRDTANLSNQEASSDTITTADSLVVNTGDTIVCFTAGGEYGRTVSSITCGGNSLTFVEDVKVTNQSEYQYSAWVATNSVSSTSTCTATWNLQVAYRGIECASYSGLASSSAIDQYSCNEGTCSSLSSGTNITSTNVTTTNANDVNIIGVLLWDTPATLTASSPYTNRTSGSSLMHILDRSMSSTGSYPNQTIGTIEASDSYVTINLTLKKQ